MKAKVPQNDVD